MRPDAGNAFLRPLQNFSRCASSLAHLEARRAAARSTASMRRDLLAHLLRRAVALAQQDRRGVEVVAGVHEVLDRGGHRLVHHLQAGRDDAGGDDRRHRVAGLAHVVEAGHDAARELRLGHQLDGDLDVTASMPSLPTTSGSRSRPGASSASPPNSTGSPSTVKPRTRSTLCRVRPYFRQCTPPEFSATLPPMRAGDLAGRVGRVVQAVRRGGLADREVAHAALHDRRARERVDARRCG